MSIKSYRKALKDTAFNEKTIEGRRKSEISSEIFPQSGKPHDGRI